MSNDLKWLIGSDFHIPYHNKRYMDLWFQVQKWFQPDVIDILGDLDDAQACSRFAAGTEDEVVNALVGYAPLVKGFFADLRANSPDADIHFATGNHEQRYDDYIKKNAPALRGIIDENTLWGTQDQGIWLSYYNNPPIHRFGDIYVHHGPYALKDAASSAKKAVDEFGVSCMVGHSHRQGYVPKSYPLRGETLRAYEIGHMADIESSGMAYDRKHDWQAGFAIAHIEDGKHPHIQLIGINERDYTCYVDGKKFSA